MANKEFKKYLISKIEETKDTIKLSKHFAGMYDAYRNVFLNVSLTTSAYISDEPTYLHAKITEEINSLQYMLANNNLTEYGRGMLATYYELVHVLKNQIAEQKQINPQLVLNSFTINKPEKWEPDLAKIEIKEYNYDSTKLNLEELRELYDYIGNILNKT